MRSSTRRDKATALRARIEALYPTLYLSYSDLSSLPAPPLLIDTRTAPERSYGTIPNSHSLSQAGAALSRSPLTQPVVVFCTVGLRSGAWARRHLRGTGRSVYNYSVMEHVWGGGQLVQPASGRPGAVHVYAQRYERVMPPEVGEVRAFPRAEALVRALPHVPEMVMAVVEYMWRRVCLRGRGEV